MKNVVGVILAGGESRRFGSPKAFAVYKGKCFYEHSLAALKRNVNDIIIVSHPSLTEKLSSSGIHVIEDEEEVKGKGPLAGIYSAMNHFRSDWYFVLPCDAPKINNAIVRYILKEIDENYDAIIPVVDGKLQPLVGAYSSRLKDKIKTQLLLKDYRMTVLFKASRVKFVFSEKEFMTDCFVNVNDQDTYASLQKNEACIELKGFDQEV